jgi:hypothetical protein
MCVVSLGSIHNSIKLKVVECAEENQNRASGRKFDVDEIFIRG